MLLSAVATGRGCAAGALNLSDSAAEQVVLSSVGCTRGCAGVDLSLARILSRLINAVPADLASQTNHKCLHVL